VSTFVPEEEDKVYMQRNKINERIERKILKTIKKKKKMILKVKIQPSHTLEPLGIYVP
jgi:hypothetical protein